MTSRRPKKGKGVGLMNNKLSAAARHRQKRHADKTERQAAAAELRAHHRGGRMKLYEWVMYGSISLIAASVAAFAWVALIRYIAWGSCQ